MRRVIIFAVLIYSFSNAVTFGDMELRPIPQALEAVKENCTKYKTLLQIRDLRKEIVDNFHEAIPAYTRFQNEEKNLLDSTGELKPGVDSLIFKAHLKALNEWRKTEVPIETKTPIKVEVSDSLMLRFAKLDYDIILKDLVLFKIQGE